MFFIRRVMVAALAKLIIRLFVRARMTENSQAKEKSQENVRKRKLARRDGMLLTNHTCAQEKKSKRKGEEIHVGE